MKIKEFKIEKIAEKENKNGSQWPGKIKKMPNIDDSRAISTYRFKREGKNLARPFNSHRFLIKTKDCFFFKST